MEWETAKRTRVENNSTDRTFCECIGRYFCFPTSVHNRHSCRLCISMFFFKRFVCSFSTCAKVLLALVFVLSTFFWSVILCVNLLHSSSDVCFGVVQRFRFSLAQRLLQRRPVFIWFVRFNVRTDSESWSLHPTFFLILHANELLRWKLVYLWLCFR